MEVRQKVFLNHMYIEYINVKCRVINSILFVRFLR